MENNGAIEHRINALEKQVEVMGKDLRGVSDKLLILEKNQEVTDEKLDSISKHTDAIVGMSYEVKNLANQVTSVVTLIEKQDERLDIIEDKPGSLAIKGWAIVIGGIASSILGVVIGTFIK